MHDDHTHGDHHHGHDHTHDHGHHHHPHGLGHNGARRPLQWQTPHDPTAIQGEDRLGEPDLDLVEAAFVTGFANAPDPTSFLRLARIPFAGQTADGNVLKLLRVETEEAVDVGAVSPPLGGGPMRHDPLPAKLISRRRRLAFVYFVGMRARSLSFAEALALAPAQAEDDLLGAP
jgi:hypothetical protein